jgi:hypothetical protein
MMKKILKLIPTNRAKRIKEAKVSEERKLLEKKVLKGTDFAIREYGEVFKKLAEYDRTLN